MPFPPVRTHDCQMDAVVQTHRAPPGGRARQAEAEATALACIPRVVHALELPKRRRYRAGIRAGECDSRALRSARRSDVVGFVRRCVLRKPTLHRIKGIACSRLCATGLGECGVCMLVVMLCVLRSSGMPTLLAVDEIAFILPVPIGSLVT